MIKTAKTEYGLVRGTSAADPRIIAYRGIPFAAPPVGKLRWHAPVPHEGWDGVRDCLEFAPISMQGTPGVNPNELYSREWHVDPEIPMSEDCLYLNIWTPAKTKDERLPVFVWYFGGGLQCGYTAEMEFDGERIARRGVVVVTVNYRVNVFGFFSHPEITKEAPEAPANFGHLDQQAGLKWVYKNIAEFGGDPERITIGGQSAGGASVMAQLNCPENAKYIKGAIVESGVFMGIGPSDRMRGHSFEDAERDGERFFEYLGVKTLDEARAIPAREIMNKLGGFRGRFGTQIDGVFQLDSYQNAIKNHTLLDVPMIWGQTNNEFFMTLPPENIDDRDKFISDVFGDRADEFKSLVGDGNAKVGMIDYAIRKLDHDMRAAGYTSPHYFYEFGPEIPGFDNPGAFHSSDIWFFFETLAKCWRPFKGGHYDLARQMCNYWCDFIASGDPNGKDADGSDMPEWKPYTEACGERMGFYGKAEPQNVPSDALMSFFVNE